MKKVFLKRFKILVLLMFFCMKYYGWISGPASVSPGSNTNMYSWGGTGQVTFLFWTTNNASAVMGSGNPAFLSVGNNILACKVVITATYNYPDPENPQYVLQATESKEIFIDPSLKTSLTTIYPGQSANIVCQDNCINQANHTVCFWDWSNPSGVNCLGCGNNSIQNSVLISFPNQGSPASHNISCLQKCNGGIYQFSMPSVTINYKLQTPTISGPVGTACNGVPSSLVYTASQDSYAGWYVWTVPPGWTINGNANGNQISVTSSGNGVGIITAKAYRSNGSAICSDAGMFSIACCPTVVYATGWVFAGPDLKTAVSQVIATSVIANGATAKYHAGDAVILNAGFCSVLGSNFHAYNEPGCNEVYYRTITQNLTENPSFEHDEIKLDSYVLNQTYKETFEIEKIKIFPNPNNGSFSIVNIENLNGLKSIEVQNTQGQIICQFEDIKTSRIEINIKNQPSGLYLVKLNYGKKIMTKKIIKE